jgi:hypothetical protein
MPSSLGLAWKDPMSWNRRWQWFQPADQDGLITREKEQGSPEIGEQLVRFWYSCKQLGLLCDLSSLGCGTQEANKETNQYCTSTEVWMT